MLFMEVNPNYIYTGHYETLEINNHLKFTLKYLEETQKLVLNNTQELSKNDIPDINSTRQTDILSRIYLAFPIGEEKGCFTAQEYYDKIEVQTEKEWDFVVQKEAIALYPKSTISLLPNQEVIVQLNAILTELIDFGMSFVHIKYVGIGNQTFAQDIPLFRKRPPLLINYFDVSDYDSGGFGDTVTLSWSMTGAEHAVITPGDIAVAQKGTRAVPVIDDTEFILYASSSTEMVSMSTKVYLEEASIMDFQADKTEVSYGDQVSISFELENTRHAFINQGVGKVAESPVEVTPLHYNTEYVIQCENKNGTVSKRVTVRVKDALELITLCFDRKMKEDKTYLYHAYWKIVNLTAIKVSTSDGVVRCENIASNEVEFTDAKESPLELIVECKGANGQSRMDRVPCNEES